MNTMEIPKPTDPIDAAVRYFGTRKALCHAIGYTNAAVSNWKARRAVPTRAAVAIELATQGAVTREDLQAVYPDPALKV